MKDPFLIEVEILADFYVERLYTGLTAGNLVETGATQQGFFQVTAFNIEPTTDASVEYIRYFLALLQPHNPSEALPNNILSLVKLLDELKVLFESDDKIQDKFSEIEIPVALQQKPKELTMLLKLKIFNAFLDKFPGDNFAAIMQDEVILKKARDLKGYFEDICHTIKIHSPSSSRSKENAYTRAHRVSTSDATSTVNVVTVMVPLTWSAIAESKAWTTRRQGKCILL